ncbi:DegT/DnrJ/EryC1/StrS family aminotransferase, partial [bacterium]|nr:DegT/DnrJ/EryC1/StrS family aminotransferase [bacterium]
RRSAPRKAASAKLAIDGGTPARSAPLPAAWPGAWMFDEEEVAAVVEVVRARSPFRHYGPNVLERAREFETEFAARMGSSCALGVTSGTAALIVALAGLEVEPEDEVILPAFTFLACPCAVVVHGAVPVIAEVNESFTLDPEDLERRITPRTKAIMVVHTLGVAADMDRITAVARRHGVKVIEDCAQSCGATYRGRQIGSIGEAGAFSLQLNKIITTGDGGVVTTSDPAIYERAVRYHDLGLVRPQFGVEPTGGAFFGNNYRMSELTAAVARVQLRKLDRILGAMRTAKAAVIEGIAGLPGLALRQIPDPDGDAASTLTLLAPDVAAADRVVAALQAENISCGKPYGGKTLYEVWGEHFEHWRQAREASGAPPPQSYQTGLCPRTEALVRRAIMISVTPILTEDDVAGIVAGIRKVWRAVV